MKRYLKKNKFSFIVGLTTISLFSILMQAPQCRFAVARWYSHQGNHEKAVKIYSQTFQSAATSWIHKKIFLDFWKTKPIFKKTISVLMNDYIQWTKPLLKKGSQAFRDGNFKEEKELYSEIGNIYHHYKQMFGPYQFSEELTESWRKVVNEAYSRLGDIYHQHDDWETAFENYREALLAYPDSPEILKTLMDSQYADRLLKIGNLTDAQFAYEELLKIDPSNPHYDLGLGIIQAQQLNYQTAFSYFVQALKLSGDYERLLTWFKNFPEGQLQSVTFKEILSEKILSFSNFDQLKNNELVSIFYYANINFNQLSNGKINQTNTEILQDIFVSASVTQDGKQPFIRVGGYTCVHRNPGYNAVIINPAHGGVEKHFIFDMLVSDLAQKQNDFVKTLSEVPPGFILAIAAQELDEKAITQSMIDAMSDFGIQGDLRKRPGWCHAAIGVKGTNPGQALELLSDHPARLKLWKRNHSEQSIIEQLENKVKTLHNNTIYLDGQISDGTVYIFKIPQHPAQDPAPVTPSQ